MLAHQILCMACGYQGSFDTQEIAIENSRSDCFTFLGHNPFTSTMHYKCPECNFYLEVDPMDIFKVYPVKGRPYLGRPGEDMSSVSMDIDFLWKLPGMIKDGVLELTKYISSRISVQ